jgi:hypothetical protein
VLRIPRRAAVVEVLVTGIDVFVLDEVVGFTLIFVLVLLLVVVAFVVGLLVVVLLLVVREAGHNFSFEELDIPEVSCSAARVELPRLKHDPIA